MSFLFSKFQAEKELPLAVRLQTATPEQVRRVRCLMVACCVVVFAILSWAMARSGITLPLTVAALAVALSGLIRASVGSHERSKQMWAHYGIKSLIPGMGIVDLVQGRRAHQAWQAQERTFAENLASVHEGETLASSNERNISPRQRRKLRSANRRPLNNLGETK